MWNTNDESFTDFGNFLKMWKRLYRYRIISTFLDFFSYKMAKIRVSIIVSIPHCPTDKALAIERRFHIFKDFFSKKMGKIGVSIIVSIPHCPTDKVQDVKMSSRQRYRIKLSTGQGGILATNHDRHSDFVHF